MRYTWYFARKTWFHKEVFSLLSPKKSHFVQYWFFEKDGLTYGNYFLCLVLDL